MNSLFQKEQATKESTQETAEDGSEVTITKDVVKLVDHKFFLKKSHPINV